MSCPPSYSLKILMQVERSINHWCHDQRGSNHASKSTTTIHTPPGRQAAVSPPRTTNCLNSTKILDSAASKVLTGRLPLLCAFDIRRLPNDLLASSITATARTAHLPPRTGSYRFNNLILVASTTAVLTVADVGPHQHQLSTTSDLCMQSCSLTIILTSL